MSASVTRTIHTEDTAFRVLHIPSQNARDVGFIRFCNTGTTPTTLFGTLYNSGGNIIGVPKSVLIADLAPKQIEVMDFSRLITAVSGKESEVIGRSWLEIQTESKDVFVQSIVGSKFSGTKTNMSTEVKKATLNGTTYFNVLQVPNSSAKDILNLYIYNTGNTPTTLFGTLFDQDGNLVFSNAPLMNWMVMNFMDELKPKETIRITSADLETLGFWSGRGRLLLSTDSADVSVQLLLREKSSSHFGFSNNAPLVNLSAATQKEVDANNNSLFYLIGIPSPEAIEVPQIRVVNLASETTTVWGTLFDPSGTPIFEDQLLTMLDSDEIAHFTSDDIASMGGSWSERAQLVVKTDSNQVATQLVARHRFGGPLTDRSSTTSKFIPISFAPPNEPPIISDLTITGNQDEILTFNSSDFTAHFVDEDGDSLTYIKITALPTNGILKLNEVAVQVNDEIDINELDKLTFTPAAGWHGTTHFSWNGRDFVTYATNDALVNITINLNTVHNLTIDKVGMGIINSEPLGISCGTDCTEGYEEGTTVKLTATPDVDSIFMGWQGDCGSITNNSINVVMDVAKNCAATFTTASFTLAPQPSIDINPTTHDFGEVKVGSSATQLLTLSNTGTSNLELGLIDIFGNASTLPPDFIKTHDTCSNAQIAPSQTCKVTVQFQPQSEGAKTATLSIPSNALETPNLAVPLSGYGIIPISDISISKIDSVAAGSKFSYILTVTNTGPTTAHQVEVTDSLPPEVTFVSASGTGWNCSEANGTVTCIREHLEITSSTITITVTAPNQPMTLTNQVRVSTTTVDSNLNDNTDQETTQVVVVSPPTQADLWITQTASANSVIVEDNFSYIVTVINTGPAMALNVTMQADLPAAVTFVSAEGDGWDCSETNHRVTCTRNYLTITASSITITVTAPQTVGSISSHASVIATTEDPQPSNNQVTEIIQIDDDPLLPKADLSIVKTDYLDPVTVASQFSYLLMVVNTGPATATHLEVQDILPPEVTFISADGDGWDCNETNGTVTCTRDSLEAIAATTITITVLVPDPADIIENIPPCNSFPCAIPDIALPTFPFAINNTAQVIAVTTDPDFSNNEVTETTQIDQAPLSGADLSIIQASSDNPVMVDSEFSYILTVTNAGPARATNVEVQAVLPSEVTFISAGGEGWNCNETDGVVTCMRSSLELITSTVTITVTAPVVCTSMEMSSTVHVSANTINDPNSDNNSDEIIILIEPPPVSPGTGIDPLGNLLSTNTCFFGAVSTESGLIGNDVIITQTEVITIASTIFVDPDHVNAIVDILITAVSKTPVGQVMYMRHGEIWKPWDGQLTSLEAAQVDMPLGKIEEVLIHEDNVANFLGEFAVYVGYRLDNGNIYHSEEPIRFAVTANNLSPLTFTNVSHAVTDTDYISNTITINGLDGSIDVIIRGDTHASIVKNGVDRGLTATTVANGDTIAIKTRSASSLGKVTNINMQAGDYAINWSVTTSSIKELDTIPGKIAGYTAGQFSVNESGAAIYQIPITIPTGTAGLQPNLALAYSNHGSNGLLGVGWSLSGLSSITRCPTTLAQDNFIDRIDFDDNDRFCLDGERLIVVNGIYGANDAEYRTEHETFSKIISYGQAGNGPEKFKVWTKAGLIMEYGYTQDSQIEAQGKDSILFWALNKIQDNNGSYLNIY